MVLENGQGPSSPRPRTDRRPRRRGLSDFAGGLALGAAGLLASFGIGMKLLARIYYVEWIAAALMAFFILIAWLLYLRDDAFMRKKPSNAPTPEQGHAGAAPEGIAPARTPQVAHTRGARRILLVAAGFLALSTFVLYFAYGIGAHL